MSKLHKNARLLLHQRTEIRSLYLSGHSLKSLSERFSVNIKTASKWAKRENSEDLPSGPKSQPANKLINEAYIEAIRKHRQTYPDDGYRTIAFHLKKEFSYAKRGTVQSVLQQLRKAQVCEDLRVEKKA